MNPRWLALVWLVGIALLRRGVTDVPLLPFGVIALSWAIFKAASVALRRRRRFRAVPLSRGVLTSIDGEIVELAPPLSCPLSGRDCVAWFATVSNGDRSGDVTRAVPFLLASRDGSSTPAIQLPSGWVARHNWSSTDQSSTERYGFQDSKPEQTAQFIRAGLSDDGATNSPDAPTLTEFQHFQIPRIVRFEPGDLITVRGAFEKAERDDAGYRGSEPLPWVPAGDVTVARGPLSARRSLLHPEILDALWWGLAAGGLLEGLEIGLALAWHASGGA